MRDYQTKANAAAAPDSIIPEKFGAGEANSILQEGENAVSRAGLTLAAADGTGEDVTQLAQAMMINGMGAQSFQDNGAVNAIQLTPKTGTSGLKLPPSYATLAGARFAFAPAATNTAAVTVSVGQTTGTQFAAKDLVNSAGAAMAAGELQAGRNIVIEYDLGNDRFFLVDIANGPLTSAGYVRLPNGLIMQWKKGVVDPADASVPTQVITYPIAFPNAVLNAQVAMEISADSTFCNFWYQTINPGLASVTVKRQDSGGVTADVTTQPHLFVIGY